jgi:hypothetical protein
VPCTAAKLLSRDEARRIAANIAKLPKLRRGKAEPVEGPAACLGGAPPRARRGPAHRRHHR